MDKYLIPKLHDSTNEKRIILGSKLEDKVYVTFPSVVLDLNQEILRCVYRNLLVECEGGPHEEEHHQHSVT